MLTKKEFESFRIETEQAMKTIAEKYGVNIHAGKINYDSNSFTLDLKVSKKKVNGKSFEQAEFEKNCIYFGLKPEDYNKSFMSNGRKFNICGIKTSARKMPILAKCEDGKTYKFSLENVQLRLGRKDFNDIE